MNENKIYLQEKIEFSQFPRIPSGSNLAGEFAMTQTRPNLSDVGSSTVNNGSYAWLKQGINQVDPGYNLGVLYTVRARQNDTTNPTAPNPNNINFKFKPIQINNTHKYYFRMEVIGLSALNTSGSIDVNLTTPNTDTNVCYIINQLPLTTVGRGSWIPCSNIIDMSNQQGITSGNYNVKISWNNPGNYYSAGSSDPKYNSLKFSGIMFVDLTECFGAGFEPTDVSILDNHLPFSIGELDFSYFTPVDTSNYYITFDDSGNFVPTQTVKGVSKQIRLITTDPDNVDIRLYDGTTYNRLTVYTIYKELDDDTKYNCIYEVLSAGPYKVYVNNSPTLLTYNFEPADAIYQLSMQIIT